MELTRDQVLDIAKLPTDPRIQLMRKDAQKLRRNIYGEGLQEYLAIINGYENKQQHELRVKFAESNAAVVEDLLRPLDNVFTAKGGTRNLVISGENKKLKKRLETGLHDVRGGRTMRDYMKGVFRDQLMSDPGGLAVVEKSPFDPKQARIVTKSIDCIKNYLVDGIVPEWVCYEADLYYNTSENTYSKESAEGTNVYFLWLVDDILSWRIKVTVDEGETSAVIVRRDTKRITGITHKHEMGVVPAVVFSPLEDLRRDVFVSPIWKQVEKLDHLSIDVSVKQIYQFLHGYPVFWEHITDCPECDGKKFIDGKVCGVCGGTGKRSQRDVSDGIKIKQPTDAESDFKIAPDVAGYIQPDLETWREQRTEIEYKYGKIFFSMWGSRYEAKDNETATGRFIDVQPVNNRLNDFSGIFETAETILISLMGRFYLPNSFKGNESSYGRRYLIETPAQIWDTYIKSKGAPVSVLDLQLTQYYESEYRKNEKMLIYFLTLLKVEPFIHNTIQEVQSMVSVSTEQKAEKTQYGNWVKTVTLDQVIASDPEKLRNELSKYTLTTIENEKTTGPASLPVL